MINKKFIEETDAYIKKIQERGIVLENGNVLFAKVKMDKITAGGIHLATDYVEIEEYKRGFGRILALPRLLDPKTDAVLKVGDYCIYPNEAPFNLYPDAVKEFLGVPAVEKKTIFSVTDNNIIMTIPAEVLHAGV